MNQRVLEWDWPRLSLLIIYLAAGNPLEGSGGSAGPLVATSRVWHFVVLCRAKRGLQSFPVISKNTFYHPKHSFWAVPEDSASVSRERVRG